MTRPRLSENRSTPPILNEDELLVASAFPVSRNIHQLTIVIREDARFEFSERITPVLTQNAVYHKETGRVSADHLGRLRSELTQLADSASRIHGNLPFHEIDPFEYESADRRTISYWRDEVRESCSLWKRALYDRFRISPEGVEAFVGKFDSVWALLLPLAEFPLIE